MIELSEMLSGTPFADNRRPGSALLYPLYLFRSLSLLLEQHARPVLRPGPSTF